MRTGPPAPELTTTAQPFLTDVQRAALDAALAAKQAAGVKGAGSAAHHKPHAHVAGRRHVAKGGSAVIKKGGAGGKFTWGKAMDPEDTGVASLDRNDPNYDSDEERSIVYQTHQSRLKAEIQAYKEEVGKIIEEYFNSGDIADVADSLEEIDVPDFSHYFVKKLVTMALDKKDREREMASVLLSALYAQVVPGEQVQKGFARLIESLDDLVLDVPAATELLALFIARAVVDDVLPPATVSKMAASEETRLAELKQHVALHLSARHSAEKMLRCWGSGAGLRYSETKASITGILTEYLDSHDVEEAARCLSALSVPFFHHELVKQAVYQAMEHPPQQAHIVRLLQRLSTTNEVSTSQLARGFQRVVDSIDDLSLDNPQAQAQFTAVVDAAKAAKLLDPDFQACAKLGSTTAVASAQNGYAHSVQAFKSASLTAIREYFDSADASEVAKRLTELDEPGLHHIFVKYAVHQALDRKDRERELVSALLSQLSPKIIGVDQLTQGFTRLLAAAEDTVLDIPDAVHLLSLFLGRVVVDEALPPSFLTSVLPSLPDGSLGVAIVQATGAMLSARHAAERLQNCWHGGMQTLDDIKQHIRTALREFLESRNVGETAQLLMDLSVPHYHHEFVKEAIELAFEKPAAAGALGDLLASLAQGGQINQTQMSKGFERIRSRLDDELLDYPAAKTQFEQLAGRAEKEGWLAST